MKDKKKNFVSIIIITYNGLSYMKDCLDSVLSQDFPRDNYEIIVADNASTDGTVDFVRSNYPGVNVRELGSNHGFAAGNNLALEYAKGDLLVFLNQDTIVLKDWLSALVDSVTVGGYDCCHSNMLLPRNDEFSGAHEKLFPKKLYYYELTKYGHVEQIVRSLDDIKTDVVGSRAISGGSFIIRQDVLDAVRVLFDHDFGMYNEDTDLALRLAGKGFRIGVVPGSVVYHFTNFSFKMSRYNIWKNVVMIRNRMLAFWKSLSVASFTLMLPYLLLSQPQKIFSRSRELGNGFVISAALAAAVAPLVVASFFWFIISIPAASRQARELARGR